MAQTRTRAFQFLVLSGLAVLGASSRASAQPSVVFDFENGTDQGWGQAFGNDQSFTFPIVNIGGSNRMQVNRTGAFQEAGRQQIDMSEPFFLAMQAAAANPSGYLLKYDYYVDTTLTTGATFLQLGTFVNSGSGYYAQYFPGTGKDLELGQAELASGQIFSGTVSRTFTDNGYAIPPADTFFRLGLIINGNGSNWPVYYDNISITPLPVPEPTSLILSAIAVPPLVAAMRRRRKTAA